MVELQESRTATNLQRLEGIACRFPGDTTLWVGHRTWSLNLSRQYGWNANTGFSAEEASAASAIHSCSGRSQHVSTCHDPLLFSNVLRRTTFGFNHAALGVDFDGGHVGKNGPCGCSVLDDDLFGQHIRQLDVADIFSDE